MFRRLPHTLPADAFYESDLEKLGFRVNEQDQVRGIQDPKKRYQYAVNRNERWNQVHKRANNAAIYRIIEQRLLDLGLDRIRLPLGSSAEENHTPIFVSKDIATKDRVIIIFGERNAEPGILSWRIIGDEGIRHGTLVEFVKAVFSAPSPVTTPTKNGNTTGGTATTATTASSTPGIIIANPCQLLWWRGGARAVSNYEWHCLPRPSAVHDSLRVDVVKNRIPDNNDYAEHVHYIFDKVIPSLLKPGAKIDIIGKEFPGKAVLDCLAEDWNTWSPRVTGMAIISPQHKVDDYIDGGAPRAFIDFLSKRCRAYFVHRASIETPVVGREEHGCNCYASGEHHYPENTFVRCWGHVLDWFNMLHVSPEYEEVKFEVVERTEEVNLGW